MELYGVILLDGKVYHITYSMYHEFYLEPVEGVKVLYIPSEWQARVKTENEGINKLVSFIIKTFARVGL